MEEEIPNARSASVREDAAAELAEEIGESVPLHSRADLLRSRRHDELALRLDAFTTREKDEEEEERKR